jgi:cytochrome c oxidase assembly protein subunit 15
MQGFLHRAAQAALASLILLVFVGATVRATGSGLGCPDWPTCWGCLIPPWKASQIDPARLDLDRFRRNAERHGIDPATITPETVLSRFNPVHTWVEFLNRLTSLPLGLSTLALFVGSFFAERRRGWLCVVAFLSLADVAFNAWLGAEVVHSGLKPGVITLHMALAFGLICLLTTAVRLTGKASMRPVATFGPLRRRIAVVSVLFFLCLVVEGILGSQVREHTDELAKSAGHLARAEWTGLLEQTTIYLVHRSASWSLLVTSALLLFWVQCSPRPGAVRPRLLFVGVLAMMVMGVILAHVAVFRVIQVLHVGMTAVLLSVAWAWLLELFTADLVAKEAAGT